MSIENKLLVLSETAAHILRLYVEQTSAANNKGVAPDDYVPYHATEDDRQAAILASEYKECTLRGAVVMSAILARSKLPKPEKKNRTPIVTPKGDKRA
jgi:hypothetical protein